MSEEKWLDVPGYEGLYAISSDGFIKRTSDASLGAIKAGRVLKFRPLPNGYLRIYLCKDGKGRDYLVHRLVLLAFAGQPSMPDAQANHLNGIKTDNRFENLEWVTQSQNVQHSLKVLGGNNKPIYPTRKICEVCGTEYEPKPKKRKRQKCCSSVCAQKMRVAAALKQRGLS